jgi:ureidoglycolate lyase
VTKEIVLRADPINAGTFASFGQLIEPGEDGTPFGPADAELVLNRGTPRFYIMRLPSRGLSFDRITRHVEVTQCLAASGEREWLLAVAPPLSPDDRAAMPDPATIKGFRISGPVAVKLHRGTWHAGPFFEAPTMDFLNLELADTNQVDHVNCHLGRDHGLVFRFEV